MTIVYATPGTIRLANKYSDRLSPDCFDKDSDGYWCWPKRGWCIDGADGTHLIHDTSLKRVEALIKSLKFGCRCPECVTHIDKFTHIREPYGTLELEDCSVAADEEVYGRYTISGRVVAGVTVSRLLGHSAVQSEVGRIHTVYYVTVDELRDRRKRSVSCG